jgi:hypothetical protein
MIHACNRPTTGVIVQNHDRLFTQPLAAANSHCPRHLRLIYEFDRHTFISTSRSAAVPELWTLGDSTHMKFLVRVMSLIGGAVSIPFFCFAARPHSWSDGSSSVHFTSIDILWAACPFTYFLISFCTSFAKRRNGRVLSAGIVGHVFLAFFVFPFFFWGAAGILVLVLSLFCAFMWRLMYFSLDNEPVA